MAAGGHGAAVPSHHAADAGVGAGDAARGGAGGHGAVVVSHHAADRVAAGYVHILQRHVLHLAAGAEAANQPYTVCPFLVDGQPRDGMVATVEGAGVLFFIISYRRPLFAREVDVGSQGAVDAEVALCGFGPCQQAVGVVDLVGIAVLRHGISLVLIQRDVIELARHGSDGSGEVAFLGAIRPQFRDFVAGHHVRLPAGDGVAVFGIFAFHHLYPVFLRALHYCTFFISTLCVGIELEGGYFVERIADGRDAHLGQLVGEGQRDGCLVVSRARAAQQVGKTLALVAEVEGATLCGVPGADGAIGCRVRPVEGRVGGGCAVVLHGVGGSLCAVVYLHGERVARVEHAARAVHGLADARLRCAPRLRFAALHAEGDAGYLKGVLSFGQTVTVRQFVLRAGSRGKEQCGCGKKYMDGMSFLHIGLFFICFRFVLPPPAKAAVAP